MRATRPKPRAETLTRNGWRVMTPRFRLTLRAIALTALLTASPAFAWDPGPRDDVGVAAVDPRTGKVLWEAWRPEEFPAGLSAEQKAAAAWLSASAEDHRRGALPPPTLLPKESVADLVVANPWPVGRMTFGMAASGGKTLIYCRYSKGVIAIDRQTRKEAWRLETTRNPYSSVVMEVGENLTLLQIGSSTPVTIHSGLIGGGESRISVGGLYPHTRKQQAAAAALLHCNGEGYLRPEVRKLADTFRADSGDPAAQATANALDKLLTTWPATRDRSRLLDGCVAALLKAHAGDPLRGVAGPDAHRVMLWCLLQELIYGRPKDGYLQQGNNYAYSGWEEIPVALTEAVKLKLVDHCRRIVAAGPAEEQPFAASILVTTAVGWAVLTDAERKALVLSPERSVWRWGAFALAKNGRRAELMAWLGERPAADRLDGIYLLKHDQPKEWVPAELTFWLACARHDPGFVAYALPSRDGPAPLAFRAPVRAYLEGELAKPTVLTYSTHAAYNLFAATWLLDSWKDAADTPLLLEYLKHPLLETSTRRDGTVGTILRRYTLRQQVRHLLERRGVTVPPGVVYEEPPVPEVP